MSKNGKPKGTRELAVKVKSAKGRKISSTLWLQRQLNDPYVAAARKEGYRSRAAYKMLEIDEKYKLLKPGQKIIDLGAAPGGWAQVAAKAVKAGEPNSTGQVVAIDFLEMGSIAGVTILQMDFMDNAAPDLLKEPLQGEKADAVISDMAAPATGHRQTDHIRIMNLCELAYDFAQEVLKPGGFFLAKVLRGGTENDLLTMMKHDFSVVRHVKPKASRSDSAEAYVLATGFRKK